jgi:hypothetical protein
MQRFIRSYAAPGVIAFFVQLIVAFAFGASSQARERFYTDLAAVPAPLVGGFEALGITAFLIAVGYTLRVIGYARLDRAAIRSRATWWAIVIGEALYVALSAYIAWVATAPIVDAGFAWISAVYLSIIVTAISVVVVIVAILVARNRKAKALAH